MSKFYPGQRWLSETEIESGIGTILAVEGWQITVLFRATMETRVYAAHSAPLSRVQFSAGNKIRTVSGATLTVEQVDADAHGVLTYQARDADGNLQTIPELDIDHHLAIHDPASRLLGGQIDDTRWFTLRVHARRYEGMVWQSPVRGLQGARMSLVPHQLYIAERVARQPHARALLADEVGLGKTIEACLILHRRIVQEQCERALIIVPPALINQWLVELLRRFTLSFSVFDEERCQDLETDSDLNPFQQAQLVLCSLELLESPQRLQQALAAGWDMLIVDEAHHLHWTPEETGNDYRIIERLSQAIDSVLLLTATPEQLGRESHFARLRLLDAERFHDLQQFIREEEAFEPVADLAEQILESPGLDEAQLQTLDDYGIKATLEDIERDRKAIARQLVDLHGTSRLLFRNTRKLISGFPERRLHAYPLQPPQGGMPEFKQAVYDKLLPNDPRRDWLIATIRELRPEKILLICSSADTAIKLEDHLLKKEGIRCAAFHEGLSIIQRDRAAAWFAESGGADVLLCSEIGSEGRNFQFAHHLILFDLPLNPDLLEQRIGRLDRIGQRELVNIHVPCITGTSHQYLFDWYQQVSNIFIGPDPVIGSMYEAIEPELKQVLETADSDATTSVIEKHQQQANQLLEELAHGRERLLSLASFDEDDADQIVGKISRLDEEQNLPSFMEQVFDLYGVESEHHSDQREVIRPGDHMMGGHFPHLPDDGTLITYDRTCALSHEDTQFLTWDHPMVTSAIDMVTSGEFGNSCLSVIHHDTLPTGTSLLELLFRIDCPSPAHLQPRRYITQPVVRLLLDSDGNNLAKQHPHEALIDIAMQVERQVASQAIQAQAEQIRELVDTGHELINRELSNIQKSSIKSVESAYGEEIQRLVVLAKHNPNIRQADILELEENLRELIRSLEHAEANLDAMRLVVVSD